MGRVMKNIEVIVTSKKPEKFVRDMAHKGYIGFIRIVEASGETKETIFCPIDTWSIEDYKRQWKEALLRLKHHEKSCLVVAYTTVDNNPAIKWWPMYRVGDTVYIQNQVVWLEEYQNKIGDKPFTPDTCYDFVHDRRTVGEDGRQLSEWSVPWTDYEKT